VKVLVTGAHGKVGRSLVPALKRAGHDVRASDLTRPSWDRVLDERQAEDYVQADLTDAGACYALARGCDVVVHTAAIPQPVHNAPHVVFGNNLLATFNMLEAAITAGVRRFVNFSSETVPGFIFAHRAFEPEYLPIDEEHPIRPQDPYAQSKWFGELLMDRAVERADIAAISIRPCWVQDVGSYEPNLGPIVRDPSVLIWNYCSYVDAYDLCEATVLAVESDLPGHEVMYVASPDTIGGHPLEETLRRHYGARQIEFRPTDRPDASAIDSSKARRLLGWEPKRSWRDYLDADGRLKEGVTEPW
jgi:nucleoside-diphosphate-sugar epimerase